MKLHKVYENLKFMLVEIKQQNEELKQQNEELKQQNEELKKQIELIIKQNMAIMGLNYKSYPKEIYDYLRDDAMELLNLKK